eukprot:1334932-Amphidinium_carterae.1
MQQNHEALKIKLWWTMREFGVLLEVVNLDETMVMMFPSHTKCWTYRKKWKGVVSSRQIGCTVTVVLPAIGDMQGPLPEGLSVIYTDMHWASQNIDHGPSRAFTGKIGPDTHWILLWDCAPVHVAVPLRKQIRENAARNVHSAERQH